MRLFHLFHSREVMYITFSYDTYRNQYNIAINAETFDILIESVI